MNRRNWASRALSKLEYALPGAFWRSRSRAGERKALVPLVGSLDFGDLRRVTPIDRSFGYRRGRPIDRYYIERYLERMSHEIRGHVLEIGDNSYTRKFGGSRVTQSSVLHVGKKSPGVDFVGSLEDGKNLPSDAFDCLILTQTLHLIYDFHAALRTVRRILRPRGILLLTTPGITQLDRGEWKSSWYWSFTEASVRKMLAGAFGTEPEVEVNGNVLAAIAFLQGLATEELSREELDTFDEAYPVTIAARIAKQSPEV